MKVVTVDPRTDVRWHTLIERYRSSVFHAPAWLAVLADTYGWDAQALVLTDAQDAPVAGLPFFRVTDMTGTRLVSLPFSDYCDPLVHEREQWDRLADVLLQEGEPIVVRPLHNSLPLTDDRFALTKQAKWHGVDLRADRDTLYRRIHESSRRAISKARRAGITIQAARDETEIRAFFELHLRVRKYKYHLLAQPYRFFENIWQHFIAQDQGVLLLARAGDTIIGGVLYLRWHDTLYYKFNASLSDHLDHRPNDLLMWEGMAYGQEHGLVALDLGLSDWDQEGLLRYKRKFATNEQTISFLRHAPAVASAPATPQIRQVLTRMTDLLTDPSVPDHITEQGGDELYRFFT